MFGRLTVRLWPLVCLALVGSRHGPRYRRGDHTVSIHVGSYLVWLPMLVPKSVVSSGLSVVAARRSVRCVGSGVRTDHWSLGSRWVAPPYFTHTLCRILWVALFIFIISRFFDRVTPPGLAIILFSVRNLELQPSGLNIIVSVIGWGSTLSWFCVIYSD